MAKILIVNNSMREVSASNKLSEFVKSTAEKLDDIEANIVSLREINLPFYNSPLTPASPEYEVTDEAAKEWQRHVKNADAVVTLTPEYNFGMAASQKNAIDWLYSEWDSKPIVAIGYGWGGAQKALPHLNDVMRKVNANILVDDAANLYFTKTIDLDGSVLDETEASDIITKSIKAVVEQVQAA